MSDTLRVDEYVATHNKPSLMYSPDKAYKEIMRLARQLERELAAERKRREDLRKDGETITERYMQFASLHNDEEDYAIAKHYNNIFKRAAIAGEGE